MLITEGDKSGVVFWDTGWEAWGWIVDGTVNGPFDSAAEAEEALREELTSKPVRAVPHELMQDHNWLTDWTA